MTLHHRSTGSVHSASRSSTLVRPSYKINKTLWQSTLSYLPILEWLPKYNIGRDLKFDIAAGITVAMMLIPQEVSLAGIMHVPPQNSLYTAATAPLVYALFGSSTVLSVASGSEVSLLVGEVLGPIKNEQERVATGILMSFLIGIILLIVRILNLSEIADFFSRPVMGGFISAGGLLIMLSQVTNWLSVNIEKSSYPPVTIYRIFEVIHQTEKYSFIVGLISIFFLILLKRLKKRYFPSVPHSQLFKTDIIPNTSHALDAEVNTHIEISTPPPIKQASSRSNQSHGFSLTDQQFLNMAAEQLARDQVHEKETIESIPTVSRSPFSQWMFFLASMACDLGPLIICIGGGIAGYYLRHTKLKITGNVPKGFPAPQLPWYGLNNGVIANDTFGSILLDSVAIAVVVYLSSIAMAKRLAIQRGESIRTEQELTGLGVASVVVGLFRGMPPTGGMSRTAVNLQNARTQLASIITTLLIIICICTLTGILHYVPKASLAAIIITAGYSLVEFTEAKWLYRVTRDEFFVWVASFVGTLVLGVMNGLYFSIGSSVLALMWKSKRAPIVVLAELENGRYVDRDMYPTETTPIDDAIVVRVERSLFFANCERVVNYIDAELEWMESQGHRVRGVVVDAYHMNDMDATTIQVLSDLEEKLAFGKMRLAIANAGGKVHDVLAATNLIKRLLAQNPRLGVEDAVRLLRQLPDKVSTTSTFPTINSVMEGV